MVKFGEILVSRPMGKDAYLSLTAYLLPKDITEPIQLDFKGVKVLAPHMGRRIYYTFSSKTRQKDRVPKHRKPFR